MEKIKVLQIITRLEAGGSSANTLAAARGLGEGFEMVLACGGVEAGAKEEAPTEGVRLIRLPHLKRSIDPVSDLRAFYELWIVLKEEAPAIVHTHTSKAGMLGRWAAFLHNVGNPRPCAVVHSPHGHVFYGYFGSLRTYFFTLLERWTALCTDRLVALSGGERRESLARSVGVPSQWTIIPSGVRMPGDEELARRRDEGRRLRHAHGLGEDVIVVGTVARLEPVKGVEHFVRAAPLVAAQFPRARFLVVGDGRERAKLEGLARRLGLERRFLFVGRQDHPLAWMSAMDVYVQPSLNEGLGRTLIEAALLGLAAAASAVCGIPDVVIDGRTGYLAPPGDPPALARAIGRLAADPEARRRLGEAARAHVLVPDENGLPRFSEAAMLRNLRELYLSLRRPS